MADTKISALTAIDAVASGDEFPANDVSATTSKKVTAQQIKDFTSPAASDTAAGIIEIAIQSEMETGTDNTRAVVPGRQHFHPSAAKFWVSWTGNSTTINESYNMTSIADTAVGIADGTIATDFAAATWCGQVSIDDTNTANDTTNTTAASFTTRAAGTFTVCSSQMTEGGTAAANPNDPDNWLVLGFGDLP